MGKECKFDFDPEGKKPKIDSDMRAILSQFHIAWINLEPLETLGRGLKEDEIRANGGFPSQDMGELIENLKKAQGDYVENRGGYWYFKPEGLDLFTVGDPNYVSNDRSKSQRAYRRQIISGPTRRTHRFLRG